MALVIAFLLGLLIGLALRPLLNTYLLWKVAQRYEDPWPQASAKPAAVRDQIAR